MRYRLKKPEKIEKVKDCLRTWTRSYRWIYSDPYLSFVFLEEPSTDDIVAIHSHYLKARGNWNRKIEKTLKKEISREIARQVYKGNMEIVDENIASKLDRSVSVFLSRLRRRAREREARIAIGYARNDLKYEFSSDDLRIIRNLEFFEVDPDEKTITFFYVPTIERGLSRRLRKRVAELVEKYSNYKVSFDVPARIKRARSTGWSGLTKWRVKSGKKFQVS